MAPRRPAGSAGEELTLEGVDLTEADFALRRIRYLAVAGSRFTRCDFSGIRVAQGGTFGAGGEYSEYIDCMFDKARLKHMRSGRATFVRCSFRDVLVDGLHCQGGGEFIDCIFSGTLKDAIFIGKVLRYEGMVPNPKEELEFRGNDFSAAKLDNIAFRNGIDLNQQRFPSGPDHLVVPDATRVLPRAMEIIDGWPNDGRDKRRARIKLRVALEDAESGQQNVFLGLADQKDPTLGPAVADAVAQAVAELKS
ncbi:hypothetical protein RB614_03250 [Phytohabitans sp. ZYX-F-186]|uniref:Pentapeptide repeat protein n=1 Tax=Phytohabitans maris TaxID=3071409 RepID=A0ABU0Z8Z7_9ACTN|nr:hypothetical protein [Phytohabitans sp. ZYX-F-186]MDQ7903529.1 hypothetical protein [Phytohabitans sp. ZYX-F-186]